jgi:SAM-dependent methyltransferase
MTVIWHDIECGAFVEDLPVWRALADRHGDPILDVGAGTGRVSLDLAHRGLRVTALDRDEALLAELALRAEQRGHALETVVADARAFELGRRFALCIVPMQTVQLLGGAEGRAAFLRCAANHLVEGGLLAIAIADELEPYRVSDGMQPPVPDMRELGGVVYSSHPVAVLEDGDGFVLERRRETITAAGERTVQKNRIRLDRLGPAQLEREGSAVGFAPAGRSQIPATEEYVGSVVVMLSG